MSVDNTTLLNQIDGYIALVKRTTINPNIEEEVKNNLLEYSLIKCFVATQRFISDTFDEYCSGGNSVRGYTPERRLTFDSSLHLHSFFDALKKGYLDSLENGIKSYSKYIFVSGKDPFALVVQDSRLWSAYNKGRYIRNFLVHSSPSATNEYYQNILNGDKRIPIVPSRDLKALHGRDSLFSIITNGLKDLSETLVDPRPLF